MSERLVPCSGCARHVQASEAACPFCGAALGAAPPARAMPAARLGRAATFAFGAAIVAATGVGCSDSHERRDAGVPADAGPREEDSGAIAPPYGAPAEDAGFAPLYGAAPGD